MPRKKYDDPRSEIEKIEGTLRNSKREITELSNALKGVNMLDSYDGIISTDTIEKLKVDIDGYFGILIQRLEEARNRFRQVI